MGFYCRGCESLYYELKNTEAERDRLKDKVRKLKERAKTQAKLVRLAKKMVATQDSLVNSLSVRKKILEMVRASSKPVSVSKMQEFCRDHDIHFMDARKTVLSLCDEGLLEITPNCRLTLAAFSAAGDNQ